MRLRNRDGTPIDPVPFFVVVCIAFLASYAWVPVYLGGLGVSTAAALVAASIGFLIATGAAYHQLVWTSDPVRRERVPVERRLQRLFYAILIGIALLSLLVILASVR
ncbi:hypothetical protein [Natronococcus wangiae]|uniref:hypothetical protein n=1 Tax=Natronococcus wangiae TaxID=3068275 RepID=UPI00273DCF0F|nr:hypothetical protein [Natronococcus sp. AD5]